MTRGATGGLDERGGAAEEALFVRIENGDEGDFREVKPFTQEINADEYIKFAFA